MNRVIVEVKTKNAFANCELEFPDNCPICHAAISPLHLYSCKEDALYSENRGDRISSVFACPKCHSLFYAKYEYEQFNISKHFRLINYGPYVPEKTSFADEVLQISPLFIEIFNQAEAAEANKLDQIAGVGYRKALEFLIKDYACKIYPDDKDAIRATLLKPCIEKYIDLPTIKDLATVSAWLGNDETHYLKRWQDMDVQDMKRFIRSCVIMMQADIDARKSADIIATIKN
jgi:hypothetical protein